MILSYDLETSLLGHIDSINALQFSSSGRYLATGGQDGQLLIFSTKTWKMVKKFVDSSPLNSLVWHPTFPKTVICGFVNGDLITICFDSSQDSSDEKTWIDNMSDPIECVALDPLGTTIAIGHGEKVSVIEQTTISVWRNIRVLPDPPSFDNLKEKLAAPTARSLHFLQEKDSLLVAYFEHGIVCWDIRSMMIKWKIVPRTRYIGRSSVSPDEQFVVVSNLFDGFDWYSLSDRTIRHTVPIHINPQMNLPVPVTFAKDGDALVVGGTSRGARVLDSRTSETTQLLPHDGDIVQAVGVFDYKDGSRTIVTCVSEIGQKTTIKVWRGRAVGVQDESGDDEVDVSKVTSKYKLLQRGFLTLELKYNRRKEELTQLRKELQVQAEGHTLRTNELTGEIGAKEGKLEELRSEFKNVAHATRAVKGIVVSELAIQLKCPVYLGLLQVPHSLSCFHVACCACVIDTFQRIGAKCSICWQSCTQLPRQDAVIAGILSVVYKLQDVEEPTLASLGLDPGVFTKFFQTSAEQLPDNLQVKIQHQPETVQEVAPAQQQGHFDLDDGGGAAPGHVHQHAHHGEGAVGGAAEALVTASDVGTSGPSQVVGFLGFSFDTQDVAMGEETGN
ncbi:WD40-repeat-containing domain protein [Thelephora terrestris]|uniref:WD40-repeat-containing domain protein n=1 Tax=Thelephora terrestris TaxID=56493 RepID=A0A9P6LAE5_9AGAM|nr:WD40-repeat-containing domain protein [Thelephora terrestris]